MGMQLALLACAAVVMTTFVVLLLGPLFAGRTTDGWRGLEQDGRLRPHRFGAGLRGEIDGFDVRVSRDERAVRIEVRGLVAGIGVARYRDGSASRWVVGDPEFDAVVALRGSMPVSMARFDPATRSLWLEAVRQVGRGDLRDLSVRGGILVAEVARDDRPHDRPPMLDELLVLAQTLRPVVEPMPSQLARRWREEPVAKARRQLAGALLWEYPGAIAEDLAKEALGNSDVWTRFLGARYLSRHDVLAGVATNPSAPWIIRVEATGLLRSCPDRVLVLDTVQRCASTGAIEVRTAAARLAGALRGDEALAVLDALLSEVVRTWDDRWDEVRNLALATADALGQLEVEGAVPALLTFLGAPTADARVVAIEGLARVGDATTADILRDLADDEDPSLRYAVRSTIRAIRARTGHPEAGAVSLATASDAQGALSIATGSS